MSRYWNQHAFCANAPLRLLLVLLWMALCAPALPAQMGISWGWVRIAAPSWNAGFQTEVTGRRTPIFRNAAGFQLDHDLPFGKSWMSLRPALGFTRATQGDPVSDRFQLEWLAMSSRVALVVRLLDVPQACDCTPVVPDGHWLREGFQAWLAPGISATRLQFATTSELFPKGKKSAWATRPFVEAGAGLELTLSHALTLMPFVRTRWYGTMHWPDLSALYTEDPVADRYDRSTVLLSMFGLRAGLRW